jgi:uncharacterized membrane protein
VSPVITKPLKQTAKAATKTAGKTAGKAGSAAGSVAGAAGDTAKSAASSATSGPLKTAVQGLTATMANRVVSSLSDRVSSTTSRLTDYTETGGKNGGLLSAVTGGGGVGTLLKDSATSVVKDKVSGVKDKVKDAVTGGGGGGKGGNKKKLKVTNIVEHIDVGVPLDVAYDQWTQYSEFPSFMKKVENVDQPEDTKTTWKAQVFWSHRVWEASIIEQVRNERIVWRSKGAKGSVDGTVTFHELSPTLTRIIVILEYHPQGLFERTGNLWRAQGRRARLEIKHFARHAMTQTILNTEDLDGWHGEIRDGEVVKTSEEADQEDQDQQDQLEGQDQDEDEADQDEDEGDQDEDEGDQDELTDEDEQADEEPEDETDEEPEDEADEEPEEETVPARRRGGDRARGNGRARARKGSNR